MLREDERVDRRNNNIFIAVNYERSVWDVFQRGVTTGGGYCSPFSNRGELCLGRVLRHRKVTVVRARIESFHVLASGRLAGFGRRKECAQQERLRVRLFFSR